MNRAANSKTSASQLCQQANLSVAEQKLEQAVTLCHQALQLQPNFAPAYKIMGVIMQMQDQLEEAKYWYNQALEHQPNFAEVHANLGSLYATQQQWEQAIKSYETALKSQPNLAGVYRNLARIWQKNDQQEKAAHCQYKAFQLEPDKLQLEDYFNLGKTLLEQNQIEQVISLYSQAIKLYPNTAKIYYLLGQAFSQNEQWTAAISNYKQAIKINQTANHYYNSLGDAFSQLQQWNEAIDCYLHSIQIKPDVCWSYLKLADAYLECQHWENAIKTYYQGLELNPDNYWPYIKIGDAYIEQGHKKEAIAIYRQAQQINPNLSTSYYKLADLLQEFYQEDEAIDLYKKALEIDPNLPFLYEKLGDLLQTKQRWQESITLYKKAVQVNPDLYELCLKLALVLKQQKNWYDAIDTLIKTLELQTDCFEAYRELANIFEEQGYLETAIFCRHHLILPSTVIETFCQYSPEQIVSLDSASDVTTFDLYSESQIKCTPPITLDDNLDDHFKPDYFQSSAAFVSIIPEGKALADPILTSAVLNAKSQLISELSSGHPEFLISHNHRYSVYELDETIAFLSVRWGNGGYFHWMFDVLARLDLVQKISEIKNLKIDKFVFSHCPHQYQIDSLNILGVTEDKIFESFHYPYLKAKQVIVPNLTEEFGISEWKCHYLKQAFLHPKLRPKIPCYKRIYIDRNKAGYRKTINNQAVVQLLEKYGFQRIYLETLSIVEQAHYLNAAEVVVAPHGAGLTNLTFCNPGTKVIEIFSPGYVTPLYWLLSNICRLEHYYLFGERLPDDDNPKVSPITRNIYVNLSQLEKLLKKAQL
ncbi:tetratricopeptide repeat protein [Lyngbya sp. PCC 8106]|uniref:tetratricopeptide repeat protein n=1 Tax=Lyngbya sp. (strain PCC 8106) TaxID=313612 RepID=UPI0000EAC670|nr:tetratricopeptide repeat protein [Lyngbya sp. PCC 8106]EAW38418.1 TPR repeat protein [Lyngbya sp. PCC 8106]